MVTRGAVLPSYVWFLAPAVILGGWLGAEYGSRRFANPVVRRVLAVVLGLFAASPVLVNAFMANPALNGTLRRAAGVLLSPRRESPSCCRALDPGPGLSLAMPAGAAGGDAAPGSVTAGHQDARVAAGRRGAAMVGSRRTIVFMPESAYGPTNNCIGIGHVLVQRGHRVVFAAESSWRGQLEALGFEERLVDLAAPPDTPQDAGQFWKDFIAETAPEFRKPTREQLAAVIKPIWQELIAGSRHVDDRLLHEAAETADARKRLDLLQRAEALMMADDPLLPLYVYVSKHLVSTRVGGWQDNSLDHHATRDLYIKD
jgi:hypothetical protein